MLRGEEGEENRVRCYGCEYSKFENGGDGFYYCIRCGVQVDDIVETATSIEDLVRGGLYSPAFTRRHLRPPTASPQAPVFDVVDHREAIQIRQQEKGKNVICDDGEQKIQKWRDSGVSYEEYYEEVRIRYVMGVQCMIQMQCEVLVKEFKVTPLICGLITSLWLRFLAFTRVCAEDWADNAILQSETLHRGEGKEVKAKRKNKEEPHNIHGQRAVLIWLKSLQETIPVSFSLAICYLACHVAREAVLPTDMFKWTLEGKLPFLNAFIELENKIGKPNRACPLSLKEMFAPSALIPVQLWEPLASTIAGCIGLSLPPINFYAVAKRYLIELSLPVDKILPKACRIYEWLFAPDLWFKIDDKKISAHICVMSMVIITIRIIYKIHGFGFWERSLGIIDSKKQEQFASIVDSFHQMEVEKLLKDLEAKYHHLLQFPEYAQDLASFLKYCKDVAFAGSESDMEYEEEKLMKNFWEHYMKHEDMKKKSQSNEGSTHKCESNMGENKAKEMEYSAEEKLRALKRDMEENKFCYIPPRQKLKNKDGYLHYARKRDEEGYAYATHADYYIVLRACARLCQVDFRIMHVAVLSLEKRLAWTEEKIDQSLHLKPPIFTCRHCDPENHPAQPSNSN